MIILIFFSVFFLVLAIFLVFQGKEKPIERLKEMEDNQKQIKDEEIKKESLIKFLARFIPKKKGKRTQLEENIIKSDIPLTLEEVYVIKILISALVTLFIYAVSRDLLISSFLMVIAFYVPDIIILKKKKDRIKEFDLQLVEAITLISNSLKAGYSLMQSIAVVKDEMMEPISKEFNRLLKEISLGKTEEEAFLDLQNRVDSEDLKLFINALLIQKDVGGNLSEILDNIAETIRERQKLKNELNALTAQGKLTGLIISLMPIFLAMIIYSFNREYIMLLFTTKIGMAMVMFGVISQIIGLFIIRKIINIDL